MLKAIPTDKGVGSISVPIATTKLIHRKPIILNYLSNGLSSIDANVRASLSCSLTSKTRGV